MLLESRGAFDLIADNVYEIVIMMVLLFLQSFLSWLKSKRHKTETDKKLESIKSEVKDVKKETSTNGGDSTLKDIVHKIDRKLDTLYDRVEAMASSDRARLEFTLNQSMVPHYLADRDGNITFVNGAMVDLFGMNAPHLLKKKRFNCILTQEEKVRVNDAFVYNMENDIEFSMKYTILNRKAQAPVTIFESCEKALDTKGNFMWYLGKIKQVEEKQ